MNAEILNSIMKLMIETANEKGIDLKEQFGTTEEFKNFVIGFTIKQIEATMGYTFTEAFEIVMGEGAMAKIAEMCEAA